ncbi:MAG: hypothetical protein DME47_09005, partial [Verrucomicrobia bacterium]
MRQLARNTLRFGPMPGEDQPDSTPEKGVSCPVKDDTGMPFRVLFESAPDGVRNLRASLERVKTKRAADVMKVQRYPVRRPENEGGGFEERFWSPINSPVFSDNGELIFIIHRVED